MRKAKPSDFPVAVEGVGNFVFGQKSLLDQVKIEAEYARLTEGVDIVPAFLHVIATAIADIKVMAVSTPEGWDIATMDGEEEETYDQILRVRAAYRKEVDTFRSGVKSPVPAGRPGNGENGGVLVPPEVPVTA